MAALISRVYRLESEQRSDQDCGSFDPFTKHVNLVVRVETVILKSLKGFMEISFNQVSLIEVNEVYNASGNRNILLTKSIEQSRSRFIKTLTWIGQSETTKQWSYFQIYIHVPHSITRSPNCQRKR
jgi:hypothetical protein